MLASSNVTLPYDPQYAGHRDADKRRREVYEWLRRREHELDRRASAKETSGSAETPNLRSGGGLPA
jgi:hypothetical protein